MIRYVEPIIRPPSEADSLILQATIGCSHNKCAFCTAYQGKKFKIRPKEELFKEIDWAGREMPNLQKVFLGDGDAMAMSTKRILELLERLHDRLPSLRRVSAYASPQNFSKKSVSDLVELRRAGLDMLYVGIESGDDEILKRIQKGVSADETAELCARPKEAGIKLFVTCVLGLGGPGLSMRHAENTALLLDRIGPRFAAALTLTILPRKPSYGEVFNDPNWLLPTPSEFMKECRRLLSCIESNGMIFYSNHASNYLPLKGKLQKDKGKMLDQIDAALDNPALMRPEFLRGL